VSTLHKCVAFQFVRPRYRINGGGRRERLHRVKACSIQPSMTSVPAGAAPEGSGWTLPRPSAPLRLLHPKTGNRSMKAYLPRCACLNMQLCKHTTSPALSIPSCESRFCNLQFSKPTSAKGCVPQSNPTGHFPRSRSICRRPEAATCGWHSSAPQDRGDQNGSLSQSFPAQQQARASASSSPSEPVGMFRGLGTSP
jgi:hypothetical protein